MCDTSRIESLLMGVRAQVWRERCQARFRHMALLQQPRNAGAIGSRPGTPGTARSETSRVCLLVDSLDRAIDPAKTQRLLHRIIVGDAGLSGGFFVVDQPDFLAIPVVLSQPIAPFLTRPGEQCFANFHA